MRIIHATTSPSTLEFLRGQGHFLRSRGAELIYLSAPGQALEDIALREGARCYSVPMTRAISPVKDGVALLRLWRRIRQLRPDVVHAHTPKAGLLVMAAAYLARVPVRIYHIHGLRYITTTGIKRALLQRAERVACRLAHRVLVVSPSVLAYAEEDGIVPPGKAAVIAQGTVNGVDSHHFSPSTAAVGADALRRTLELTPGTSVVGFIGRISADKGIGDLAQIWSRVRTGPASPHLVIVGDDDHSDPAPAEAVEQLRTDPRVHFVGPQTDVRPYYGMFDLVALPTYREGFPQVLLEASACAVPSVAYDVTGVHDAIVDNRTGILIPFGDTHLFAAEIRRLLDDPRLRSTLGVRGRDRAVADYAPEPIRQQFWDFERELFDYVGGRARAESGRR